ENIQTQQALLEEPQHSRGSVRRQLLQKTTTPSGDKIERPRTHGKSESNDGGTGRVLSQRGRRNRDTGAQHRAQQMAQQKIQSFRRVQMAAIGFPQAYR